MSLYSNEENLEDDCFCVEQTVGAAGQRSCFMNGEFLFYCRFHIFYGPTTITPLLLMDYILKKNSTRQYGNPNKKCEENTT
ncbi:hypothetical protein BDFB_004279, partial [Asbolus verrucosus]